MRRQAAIKPEEIPMAKHAKKATNKNRAPAKPRLARAVKNPLNVEESRSPATPRADTKSARVIALLMSSAGATIPMMMQETGWQAHSVRGFLSGVVRKKRNLKLQLSKLEGQRRYRLEPDASLHVSRRSKRRAD